MYDIRRDTSCARQGLVDLVPREDLVRGDVKRMADGLGVAEEAHKALGEVGAVGDGPEGSAVAVDDDAFALAHAFDYGPWIFTVESGWDGRKVIGVRGADDGEGEAARAVFSHQKVFARDFVARVFPTRVGKRRRLGDQVVRGRFLVGGGGADEDVLARLAGEDADVTRDLVGGECDPVDDSVKHLSREGLCDSGFVVDVRLDELDARRRAVVLRAAVQQIQVNAFLDR